MALVSVKTLIEAGVHFGHKLSRWNPKMEPYIYGRRNQIHIIDLRETIKGIIRAYNFLQNISRSGEDILFVGTKKQASKVIEAEAKRCGMHYVSERWLGGTLTNFETIMSRLKRLEELEQMEKDGTINLYSKKMISSLQREKRKLVRNLGGIRRMKKLPAALIIVDPQRDNIPLKEAAKLKIPTICLLDTDCDPTLVDIPIPGNDDAMKVIQIIISKLSDAVINGSKLKKQRTPTKPTPKKPAPKHKKKTETQNKKQEKIVKEKKQEESKTSSKKTEPKK